jgi:hypothetical protein
MQGITLAVTYLLLLVVGLAIAIGIGLLTDRINAPISLLVFFAGAIGAAALAWPLAVRLTEPAVQRG